MTAEGITRVKRRGALVLDNNTVYDKTISYTALGVLAVLLARPDDAPKGYRTLLRPEAGVGQASILSALRELRAAGYRYQFLRTETKGGHNKVYTDTYIYETPATLAEAKKDHFDATGCVAKDVPDRRKGKGTLASVPDAHDPDAHGSGAHAPEAQNLGSASGLSGPEKTPGQINQREAGATAQNAASTPSVAAKRYDAAECSTCPTVWVAELLSKDGQCPRCLHASPAGQTEDGAISPARQAIREMVAPAREKRLRSTGIKEIASLSHDQEQVTA